MGYAGFAKKHGRSLGRQLAKTSKSAPGGGGGGFFGDRLVLPCVDEDPLEILIFPGEYETIIQAPNKKLIKEVYDYALIYEHFHAGKRTGTTCSAGLQLMKDRDGDWVVTTGKKPCVPCYHIGDGAKGISRRKLHVFNVIVLDHFHQVDSEKTDKENKPYKEWVSCEGRRCKYCKKDVKRVFGRHMYWPIGSGYIGNLLGYEANIFAKHCACGGKLEPVAFQCSNEECEDIVRDLEDEPASKKELADLRTSSFRCPECGEMDLLQEIPECDSCNKPTPIGLYDVVMQVSSSMTTKDKKRKDFVKSNLLIPQWRRATDKDRRKVEELMKPFDFYGRMYKPASLEDQASKLDVVNPYEEDEGPRKSKYVDYENDNEDSDE